MAQTGRNGFFSIDLQWQILIGIVLGIGCGLLLGSLSAAGVQPALLQGINRLFQYGGDVFLRVLRMVILPLVFSSVFMAVVNIGNIRKLGTIGGYTLLYYTATTAVAVLTGLILVNVIHPGIGINPSVLEHLSIRQGIPDAVRSMEVGQRNPLFILAETVLGIIPENIAASFTEGNILQVIFFALATAMVAAATGSTAQPLTAVVAGIDRIMQKMVELIMRIAPVCIFFLVASLTMDLGFPALAALARYGATVLIGLTIHSCVSLPLLVLIVTRTNPWHLFRAVLPALMTAWSTASSAATLPVTLDCLRQRARYDERISSFVVTLGATINMDGTALYESVAVIFIAELLGIPLTLSMQVIIFITATLAAVGAAAIPGAGLITMGIVLSAVGLPLEGIGLILVIDRVLDQFRTSVNVWGDITAAAVVQKLEMNSRSRL
jgi:proton glutamate symport protein